MRGLIKKADLLPITNKRKHRIPVTALSLACVCLLVGITACASPAFINYAPPVLPFNYYQCYETTPKELLGAYFGTYARPWLSDMMYTGQVFVLKNIEVTQRMLQDKGPDYIWVDQIICYTEHPDTVSKLKTGQLLDVVGVNRGISTEWKYCLLMTECYFLPAGSLALPAGDAPVFSAGY